MIDEGHSCSICRRVLFAADEATRAMCEDCARMTGGIALPPPRRRVMPCVRCNHAKIVRVIPRELGADVAAPMYAAYKLRRSGVGVPPMPIEARAGYGVLEAYICKRCGFVEWYCQTPEEIPIGPQYMTEELDADGEGPYR